MKNLHLIECTRPWKLEFRRQLGPEEAVVAGEGVGVGVAGVGSGGGGGVGGGGVGGQVGVGAGGVGGGTGGDVDGAEFAQVRRRFIPFTASALPRFGQKSVFLELRLPSC